MTINQRIRDLIKFLNLNPNQFAKKLGYERGEKIYKIVNDLHEPGYDLIRDIAQKIENVNSEWLLTGIGEMFKNSLVTSDPQSKYGLKPMPDIITVTVDKSGNEIVPIVNYKAAATYIAGYQTQEYFETLDTVSLPKHFTKGRGHTRAFQVIGDSMEITLFKDEVVAAEFKERDRWNEIQDGSVVVVVSETKGIQIKRAYQKLVKRGEIRFRSDNKSGQHPSFSLYHEEITELWVAFAKVGYDLSNRSESMYLKIEALEARSEEQEDAISDLQAQVRGLIDQIDRLKFKR